MLNRSIRNMFNNLNPNKRFGKEYFTMYKILAALAAIGIIGISTSASAATPSFWSVQGDGQLSGDSIQIERGKDVGVFLSADTQGTFKAPEGWTTKWNAGKCAPARPQSTCGTWEAHAAATKNDNPTFSYTGSEAGAKPEQKVIVINVLATSDEKYYPKSKGEETEKRVTAVENRKTSVTLGLYYGFVPNLKTTTQPGHGAELNVGASVIDGLYVGGAMSFSRTEIPINMDLNPAVTSSSEYRFLLVGRIGWYPKFDDHFRMLLGGQLGAENYYYSTTFVRDDGISHFTRENSQWAFSISPVIAFEVPIVDNFGFGAQFTVPVAVNNVSRVIGEGTDANGNPIPGVSIGAPQANPTFQFGFKTWF